MSYAALPTLRTPRLTLRPLTQTDADDIVAGVGNFDVSKWLGVVPYPYDRADALDYIDRVEAAGAPVWGIHDADGLIGIVSTTHELGYWLARRVWRNGYGFEAAHAALAHWFQDPGHEDILSGHFFGNDRSRAVLQALGFEDVAQRTRYAKSLSQEVSSYEMRLSRQVFQERQRFVVLTDRLRLRPVRAEDDAFIVSLARPEVTRMLFSLKPGIDLDGARAFLAARAWAGMPGFALAIEREGHAIGYVATGSSKGVELYYALHPDHWGQGLMTEAVAAFCPELFKRFPIRRLLADRFEDNPASGRVLEKCGFQKTGRTVGRSPARLEPAPCITYALTREKLRARR